MSGLALVYIGIPSVRVPSALDFGQEKYGQISLHGPYCLSVGQIRFWMRKYQILFTIRVDSDSVANAVIWN